MKNSHKKMAMFVLLVFTVIICCGCGKPKEVKDLEICLKVENTEYNGVYSGLVTGKKPTGDGIFSYSDADIDFTYSGTWENGMLVGVGNLEVKPYAIEFYGNNYMGCYSGEAINGVPNGNGTFNYKSGDCILNYQGNWEDGIFSDDGFLEFNNFSLAFEEEIYTGTYKGETLSGVPNGNGSFSYNSMDRYMEYDGAWSNGQFSGAGYLKSNLYVLHLPEKSSDGRQGEYKGETIDGVASGSGEFTATNQYGEKYTYTGEWENGLFNGYGVIRYEQDNTTYVGNYSNGEFKPTVREMFENLGGMYGEYAFHLNDNACGFLDEYPEIFLDAAKIIYTDVKFENDLNYDEYKRAPHKYGGKLMTVQNLTITGVQEDDVFGYHLTEIFARGDTNQEYIVYMLSPVSVAVGSKITLHALPLDMFTFPNYDGKIILEMACAGVAVT